jgi:hypothetical protein
MATLTTIFRPDPTCYAPSNLWLNVRPAWGCGTYYPPFGPRPTEIVPLVCGVPVLGHPRVERNNDLCYQKHSVTTGATIYRNTAYSACPEGMTGVRTDTKEYSLVPDVTVVTTICCPT